MHSRSANNAALHPLSASLADSAKSLTDNYGPFQRPKQFLPFIIIDALEQRPLPMKDTIPISGITFRQKN
jgi:hypothetical protein